MPPPIHLYRGTDMNQTIDVSTIKAGMYHFEARRDKTLGGMTYSKGDEFSFDSRDFMTRDALRRCLVLTQPPSNSLRLVRVDVEAAPVETGEVVIPAMPPVPRKNRAKTAVA